MAKTDVAVCRLAGRELGFQAVSQAVPGGVYADISDTFDNLLAELQGREIIAWGSDETPDECANSLAMLLAQRCAGLAAPDIRARLEAMGNRPYMNFIAAAGKKWSGGPSGADRF